MRSSVYLLGDIALFSVFTVTHAVTDAKTDAVQENRSPVTHCALRLVVTLAKKIACGQYGCRCHRDKAKLYSGTYPVIKAGLPESDCPETTKRSVKELNQFSTSLIRTTRSGLVSCRKPFMHKSKALGVGRPEIKMEDPI
jgi:hypothetical protein